MASVKSGRCGYHRFLRRLGISLEMGGLGTRRLGLGDIQAVLAAQGEPFCASGQSWGRATGVSGDVANGRAVKITSCSRSPVRTCKPSDETIALTSGARKGSKWSAGILGLFDPYRRKESLGRAGVCEAGVWREIGLGQSVAEFAGDLSAIKVA